MKWISQRSLSIPLPSSQRAVCLGAGWLLVLPAAVWGLAALYIPVLGPFLNPAESWLAAAGIVLFCLLSLIAHAAAHQAVAGPDRLPLYLLGEPAQIWPAARSARQEALAALAGPLGSLALAGLAYLLWEAQLHPYLNVGAFFLIFFNLAVAAFNLSPAYPLDGGRLLRALLGGLLGRPIQAAWLATVLGYGLAAGFAGWGIFLIVGQTYLGWQTGAANLVLAALVLWGLALAPARPGDRPLSAGRPRLFFLRALLAGLLFLVLLAVPLALAPTNYGLEAPGFAVPVEPMVKVPPERAYPPAGSFILTTVIWQTPILAGQWLHGLWSPAMEVVPPQRLIPPDQTVQQVAQRQYHLLDESETTAIAVGLRLAGYEVKVEGEGVRVISALAGSPAAAALRPGDVITGLGGQPIQTTAELINAVRAQPTGGSVRLRLEREGQVREETVPLLPPAQPGEPPRLGVMIESAGFDVSLPFPVTIVPQKITGGPSAGLMFALTVYNLVTPGDLTGGRKIAGTGTLDLDGTVGVIGGVAQKVAGAEGAGAEYFLAPPDNYDEARAVARRIKVIRVATAEEAIRFLEGLAEGNGAF